MGEKIRGNLRCKAHTALLKIVITSLYVHEARTLNSLDIK